MRDAFLARFDIARIPPRNRLPTPDKEVIADGRDIPEPLVWKWLEDLAVACELLQNGVDKRHGPAEPKVNYTIVHRDIKPHNFFLDLPSEVNGDWPGYPIAVMGDFGQLTSMHLRYLDDLQTDNVRFQAFRSILMTTMKTIRWLTMGGRGLKASLHSSRRLFSMQELSAIRKWAN